MTPILIIKARRGTASYPPVPRDFFFSVSPFLDWWSVFLCLHLFLSFFCGDSFHFSCLFVSRDSALCLWFPQRQTDYTIQNL